LLLHRLAVVAPVRAGAAEGVSALGDPVAETAGGHDPAILLLLFDLLVRGLQVKAPEMPAGQQFLQEVR
jgi:hypothetical protein